MKQIRIGLIGYGFMGRAHSNAYRKVNNFFDLDYQPVLKAICARNADNAAAFSRIDPNGAWGPYSCVQGYVWREAREGDLRAHEEPDRRDQLDLGPAVLVRVPMLQVDDRHQTPAAQDGY